jgi:hypothetical protein
MAYGMCTPEEDKRGAKMNSDWVGLGWEMGQKESALEQNGNWAWEYTVQ